MNPSSSCSGSSGGWWESPWGALGRDGVQAVTPCPHRFHMDPSGTFVQCDARAIGSASEGAQSSLQEVYHKSMTLKEAIKSSLVILKQVMEEKLNATNIELATVEPGMKFHMYTKEELEEVIKDI
ncbi:hypothetical protein EK904_014610 [Melospiza melodia maxima]|nr:hypothetical protein EK904_014610 [Melospiza melodia maxima]